MSKIQNAILRKYRISGNQFTAYLEVQNQKNDRWRRIWSCGNTGVAEDVVDLLRTLGFRVIYNIEEISTGDRELQCLKSAQI